jgi:hypothetical protein
MGICQWRSNQVSGASLPKTGIFAVAAGDFRHIGLGFSEFGSLETVQQIAKARQLWPFLLVSGVVSPVPRLLGWRCSADRTRLHAISLLSGNLTGNFAILRHLETVLAQETAVLQPLIEQFPTQINREIISEIREFLSDNRDFFWKVRKRPFLTHLSL